MLQITTSSREFFQEIMSRKQNKIYLYGATQICDMMMELLCRHKQFIVEGYLDKNPALEGLLRRGRYPILHPAQLKSTEPVAIIVGVESYKEVVEQLQEWGLRALVLIPKLEMQDDQKYRVDFNQQMAYLRQMMLTTTDMSFFSNDCAAGFLYKYFLDLPYASPTIYTIIHTDDYLRLLENLKSYLSLELKFGGYQYRTALAPRYPVGMLGDIPIHFVHSTQWEHTLEQWERRIKRVNFENLFFIFDEFEHISAANADRFNRIPLGKKLIKKRTSYFAKPNVLYSPSRFFDRGTFLESWMDLVGWINGEECY